MHAYVRAFGEKNAGDSGAALGNNVREARGDGVAEAEGFVDAGCEVREMLERGDGDWGGRGEGEGG